MFAEFYLLAFLFFFLLNDSHSFELQQGKISEAEKDYLEKKESRKL